MTLPVSTSLAEQREELQRQLRAQRELIINQLGPEPDPERPRFPRSATMRFFTGRTGFGLLSQIASWKLGPHYPRMLIAAQTAARYFLSRKKSRSANDNAS